MIKKWIWFFWFLASNGFNTQKAIDDVNQVIRQYEWEEKIGINDDCFCGYDGNDCDDDCDCICHDDDCDCDCDCTDCTCEEE